MQSTQPPPTAPGAPLRSASHTLQGPRERNEDAVLSLPEHGVFAVADGMGGLLDGHAAARTALDILRQAAPALAARFARTDTAARTALLADIDALFLRASQAVAALAQQRGGRMGCTLTVLLVAGQRLMVAHVGDSRAYLLRGDTARLLTQDHSVAALRVRMGRMRAEDAVSSPLRNRLYQAIGVSEDPEPDVVELQARPEDKLLLCSDGVWEPLQHTALGPLSQGLSATSAVRAIVGAAERAGLHDNATALVVEPMVPAATADPIAVLRQCSLFADVDADELMRLAPWLGVQRLVPGQPLVREGEPGDAILVLAQGRLRVHRGTTHLVDLAPGAHLGEIAMLLGTARSASVSAIEPCVVYHLPRHHLHELMRRRPVLGSAITWRMAQFLAQRVVDLSAR